MRSLWISLLLIVLSQAVLAQRTLDTISLQQADARQIIPALRPHLSEGSSISQFQNTLVINATEKEWQAVRKLLKQLDQQGKQLLITVRTDGNQNESRESVNVDGSWGNDNVRISTSPSGIQTETHTRITVSNRNAHSSSAGDQSVRATEGYPAYISTGQSVPIRSHSYYGKTTELVDVSSGFYVTAFITDNQVQLQLNQKNDQLQKGQIKTQQLQSSVNGQLGQWITIGSLGDNKRRDSEGILSTGKQAQSSDQLIYLKVELVN
jgi:hypothetical protein